VSSCQPEDPTSYVLLTSIRVHASWKKSMEEHGDPETTSRPTQRSPRMQLQSSFHHCTASLAQLWRSSDPFNKSYQVPQPSKYFRNSRWLKPSHRSACSCTTRPPPRTTHSQSRSSTLHVGSRDRDLTGLAPKPSKQRRRHTGSVEVPGTSSP
jgi:hypothetical protein